MGLLDFIFRRSRPSRNSAENGTSTNQYGTIPDSPDHKRQNTDTSKAINCYGQFFQYRDIRDKCSKCSIKDSCRQESIAEAGKIAERKQREERVPHLIQLSDDAKAKAKELWSLGVAMDTMGQRERALGYFDEALSFDAQDPQIWQSMGFTFQMLRKYEEAIRSYKRALEVGQTRKWNGILATLCDMGEAYEALGKYEEAIACYDRVSKINPNSTLPEQIRRGERLGNYRGTIRIGGKVVR